MTDTEEDQRTFRSVSQVKDWEKCPYAFKLKRIDKLWRKPAAWLPQGLGVHEAAEAWEKSERKMPLQEVEDVFRASYAEHINRLAEDTPNFTKWFRSGGYRRTVEEDIERRYHIGLEQTGRYLDYYTRKPNEVLFRTTDDEPYVEQPFEMLLGDVWVRGYVDQVTWDEELGEWVVRDVKTGKSPGDEFQLAVYGIALLDEYDLKIRHGDYWMAVSGKPTIPYDLTDFSRERITDEFGRFDEEIRTQDYTPRPSVDACKMCEVNWACESRAVDSF